MAFDFPSAPTLGQTYTPTGGPTYVWNGTAWVVLSPGSSYSTTVFTATASQTTFSTTYVVGAIYVYRNGVLLAPADYTATNGTSIVLANACAAGDVVEVINLAQVPYVNCVQKTGDTMTGNLNFSGNGLRITGDFSNATIANRLMFQTSTANNNTFLGILPNGTAGVSEFFTFSSSDTANASYGGLTANTSASQVAIESGKSGTASYFPMTFYTGGSERVRIDTSGNVGIGTSSPGSTFEVSNAGSGQIRVGAGSAGAGYTYDIGRETTNGFLRFYGNQTGATGYIFGGVNGERMRIDSSGNVGIGTSSPGVKLDVSVPNGTQGINCAGIGIGNGTAFAVGESEIYTSSNDLGIGTGGSNNLRFWTASAERARIDSNGNLLVGTTSSSARFVVKGSGNTSATYVNSYTNSSNANLGYLRDDGALNLGTTTLSPYNLTTATAANAVLDANGFLYRSTSSLKYKRDVTDATHGLSELLKLRPVTYKSKSENNGETVFGGLIAEEVHDAGLTEFVQYAEDGTPDALAYGNMVSLCIKAIQELSAKLDEANARIAKLEGAA